MPLMSCVFQTHHFVHPDLLTINLKPTACKGCSMDWYAHYALTLAGLEKNKKPTSTSTTNTQKSSNQKAPTKTTTKKAPTPAKKASPKKKPTPSEKVHTWTITLP